MQFSPTQSDDDDDDEANAIELDNESLSVLMSY